MRGVERPANVKWTRPFLHPLEPLSLAAARRTFSDISDLDSDDAQIDDLLALTDNLPLAITLIAHLSETEEPEVLIARWKLETTSLLSEGGDKQFNLDKSIMVSISSPRMEATLGARDLLSILSLLPDGMSDVYQDDVGLNLHQNDVVRCRITLCRTSLAYIDHSGRLKVLAPIRAFVLNNFPPPVLLVHPISDRMCSLLEPFENWDLSASSGLVGQVSTELGNIQSLVQYLISHEGINGVILQCVIHLANYTRVTSLGSFDMLWSIKDLIETLHDQQLKGRYFLAWSKIDDRDSSMELLVSKAVHCFETTNDFRGQGV